MITISSRRERMVYIISFLCVAFYIFCVLRNISLYEATAAITPLAGLAGYYVSQETVRKSEDEKRL